MLTTADMDWMKRLDAELARAMAVAPRDVALAQSRAVPFRVSFDVPSITEPAFVVADPGRAHG